MPKILDIDILSTGVNVDAFGNVVETDINKLNEIANSYDPKLFKGKLVLGHSTDAAFMSGRVPSDKIPAYGTIEKVYVKGDKLRAITEVADDAVDWIANKHFTDRSVALYSPASPYSPKQGEYYIRHLALLGAAPPAIKGLQPLDEILAESYSETADLGIETITMKIEDKDKMKDEANMEGTMPVGTTDEQPTAKGAKSPDKVDATGGKAKVLPEANAQPEDPAVPVEDEANGEVPPQFKKKDEEKKEPEANMEYDKEANGEEAKVVETETEETVVAEDEANMQPDDVALAEEDEMKEETEDEDPVDFLNENVETFLAAILTDGDEGYQGEISGFDPAPAQENNWLTDEKGNFAGIFIDDSLGEPERFEFTLERNGENWVQSFKPENGEEAVEEAAMDEEEVTEEVEANGQKPVALKEDDDKESPIEEAVEEEVEANGQMNNSDARVSESVIEPKVEANCGDMMVDEQPVMALDPRDKEIAMLKKMLMEKAEAELYRQGAELYSEGILIEGQIPQDELNKVLSTLNGMPTTIAAFGEEFETPAEMLLGMLSKLPKQIVFGELTTSEEKVEKRLPIVEPVGVAFSEEGTEHMKEIVAYCEKNKLNVKDLNDFRKAMRATAPEG